MDNKTLQTPDFKKEWQIAFENNNDNILNYISNLSELNITIESSPSEDIIEFKKNSSYVPENLIQIKENKIVTKYITKEFIEFILNNLSENIETLNVPGEFIKHVTTIGLYPKLTTFKISDDFALTSKDIENITFYTNINYIEASNLKTLTENYDLNALYYDGKFQEIKLLQDDLIIKNPNKRQNIQSHNFIIPNIYNYLIDVVDFMKENGLDPKEYKYFNAISATQNEDYVNYNNEAEEIEYYGDISKLKEIINYMIDLEYYPEHLYLILENKDYDYKYLREIKFPVAIDYGDISPASIDEFITMREAINYYKELITSANLSPLEQITYAYDIIKSFNYSEGYHAEDSRSMHKIVKSGNIVCVGYALFLKQVLSELGFKIEDYSVNAPNDYGRYSNFKTNHRRNLIRIDDDKYNIHMVAALDATWDSGNDTNSKELFNNENSIILGNVSNLLSYIHFLITKNEYQYIFEDKETPSFFSYPPEIIEEKIEFLPKIVDRNTDMNDAIYYYQQLFNKEEASLIKSYINAKRPTYEIFKEVISNVKLAEGYGNDTEEFVNDMVIEETNKIKTR